MYYSSGLQTIYSKLGLIEKPPIAFIIAQPAQLSHFDVRESMNIRVPTYFLISLMNLLPAPPIQCRYMFTFYIKERCLRGFLRPLIATLLQVEELLSKWNYYHFFQDFSKRLYSQQNFFQFYLLKYSDPMNSLGLNQHLF